MKPISSWILIADGGCARVLTSAGAGFEGGLRGGLASQRRRCDAGSAHDAYHSSIAGNHHEYVNAALMTPDTILYSMIGARRSKVAWR